MTVNIARPTRARIRPLPPEDREPEAKALIDSISSSSTDNTFHTLARHPSLLRTWMPFTVALAVTGALPPRLRELTILRTGWNCRCEYEFGQHADACISDDTWALLATHLDEKQLIEVPILVGQYHLVAYMLNSLGIEREPGLGGFDD